jgi:hypothetical protein
MRKVSFTRREEDGKNIYDLTIRESDVTYIKSFSEDEALDLVSELLTWLYDKIATPTFTAILNA